MSRSSRLVGRMSSGSCRIRCVGVELSWRVLGFLQREGQTPGWFTVSAIVLPKGIGDADWDDDELQR